MFEGPAHSFCALHLGFTKLAMNPHENPLGEGTTDTVISFYTLGSEAFLNSSPWSYH